MKRVLLCPLAVVVLVSAAAFGLDKPRVFITDSKSWEMSGGGGGSSDAFGGGSHGGARPQTAEIIKTFGQKCPSVTINMKQEKADYVVVLEHEGGKSWFRKDNKVAVFNWDGDSIASKSTASLGGSVEEACRAIEQHWTAHAAERAAALAAAPAPSASAASAPAAAPATPATPKVSVVSEPAGADIEVDGAFVGNTPSTIDMAAGEHLVRVSKSGYQAWERKMKVTSGAININAQLEPIKPAGQ